MTLNVLRLSRFRRVATGGLAAVALAAGTTWLMAGDGSAPAEGRIRLAQATSKSAEAATNSIFDAKQKAAIGQIIKEYLLANPEVMLDVQTALESRMEKLQAEKFRVALQSNAAAIFRSPDAPIAGNPKGDVPVVEFFDYNCGYCKRAFGDISKFVEQDKNIRLILKELPILSKGSEEAARVALAARAQGLYWPVHRALIALRGQVNGEVALRTAEKIKGIDMAKLKRDIDSEAVTAEIKRVRGLAQSMGIQGTPHFLVGDKAIPGAPTDLLAQLKSHADELRKSGGCKVC